MTTSLPAAGRLAWWGTAWLRGHVVADLVIDAIIGQDATHTLAGLPGADRTETLLAGLARLRSLGVGLIGAAFPAEGDPVGLGGPPEFNAEALEVGQAAVAPEAGIGLVPQRTGAAIAWVARPAAPRQVVDVGEADRQLRLDLIRAAEALSALDVARWRPEVADRLMNLRHLDVPTAPPGTPARCVELAARGLQATGIVELALEDDGGSIAADEVAARRAALTPLARAGRRALVAACSPEAWPPA